MSGYMKIVIVGDGAVGKTCMLQTYATGQFPTEYIPTVFDQYAAEVYVDGKKVNIGLWDTAGQEDYDNIRSLSYPGTDCFIMCYSVNSQASFTNLRQKWYPDIHKDYPDVPIVIVGTKSDIRLDSVAVSEMMARGISLVNEAEASRLAYDYIRAAAWVECSALSGQNLKTVFDEAIRAVLRNRMRKEKRANNSRCTIL